MRTHLWMCMILRFVECFGSEHSKFELGEEAHTSSPSPWKAAGLLQFGVPTKKGEI